MELQQARYVLAVAETQNFTRAAETCHVTQPALTRAIQRLESELGGDLIVRERKRTQLTDLGKLVLPELRSMVVSGGRRTSPCEKFSEQRHCATEDRIDAVRFRQPHRSTARRSREADAGFARRRGGAYRRSAGGNAS